MRDSRRGEQGSAVVDFVLVLLLLLPLFAGVLQVGLVLHVQNTLTAAAAEAARHAALQGSSPELGAAEGRAQVATALGSDFLAEVRVEEADVAGSRGFRATIDAGVSVFGMGGPVIKVHATGHAIAEDQAVDP